MSRRAFFEVASTLLGLYFIVSGFSSLPLLLMHPGFHQVTVFRQIQVLLSPILFVVAGLCLILKNRALAGWLFTDEDEVKPTRQAIRLSQCFEVGARLLGLYFLVAHSLPSVTGMAVDVKENGFDGLEIRSALATSLVLIASLVMLLKSDWLAGILYSDPDSNRA